MFGLIRHYGWKKDLLAVAAGFLCCAGLHLLMGLVSNVRILGELNPVVAFSPFIGFFLGIWGILGFLAEYVGSYIFAFLSGENVLQYFPFQLYIGSAIALAVYSALPSILWYALPLKGEERAVYPRLDTSAHVIKYYLITVITLIVYMSINMIGVNAVLVQDYFLSLAAVFLQYLDAVLFIGMPILILISVIRNRTITINERMVLAFLMVGVIASAIGAYLVYRTTLRLDPAIFKDYESLMQSDVLDISDHDLEVIDNYEKFWTWFSVITTIMLNVLLAVEIVFMRSIEKKVTRPIIHLKDVLSDYTDQEVGGFDPESVKAQCRPFRYGYGEVSDLTRTCVKMVGEIDSYTKNLQSVTAEKERIGAELDIAAEIQGDMLPSIFPPFPDRTEIDLYASMTPAKEVGGDFYDFYFIDDDHLALTIADVSGKGVPAALFMVISKTLLKNQALTGGSPKEIITYVNHQLCQNNKSMMFCTVWLGILELSTGKLVEANAGHEYPAIRRKDGQFELRKERHDPPIGLRDGLRYHEYELTLSPGDCLFEYTDGVTEATNVSMELFGEERMTEALNQEEDIRPEQLIRRIYDSIQGFVKEASQFDDITMLCVKYEGSKNGSDEKRVVLTVPAQVDRLEEVIGFTEEQLEKAGCSQEDVFIITLSVEEIFVNIAHYAYDGGEGEAEISFSFDENDRMVEMVFSDSGIPFDPTSRMTPDVASSRPGDRPIGGLGIHIVKKTMDDVKYQYLGGRNSLTIRKHI